LPRANGWIEDTNWANYEYDTCYYAHRKSFKRRSPRRTIQMLKLLWEREKTLKRTIFPNPLKGRVYRYMASKGPSSGPRGSVLRISENLIFL